MMKAGFALNIIGIFVVTIFAYFLAPQIFKDAENFYNLCNSIF